MKVTRQQPTIVLVGDFNPAIFQPAWFGAQELVRQAEADHAEVELIHADMSKFRLGGITITVLRNRFQAETEDIALEGALRDLVMGTFALLEHTPVTALGINRLIWAEARDEATWHRLGHTLAPQSPWRDILSKPGMLSLQVLAPRDDGLDGDCRIKVQPILASPPGVHFDINHNLRSQGGAKALMGLLGLHYERLQRDAATVPDRVMTHVDAQEQRHDG